MSDEATRQDGGWYWVRPNGWADFQPARYVSSSADWQCSLILGALKEPDLSEIGPRIPAPDEDIESRLAGPTRGAESQNTLKHPCICGHAWYEHDGPNHSTGEGCIFCECKLSYRTPVVPPTAQARPIVTREQVQKMIGSWIESKDTVENSLIASLRQLGIEVTE